METISVHEAVRRATDPYGREGLANGAARPPAQEVIDRLRADGFEIVSINGPRYDEDGVCFHCGVAATDRERLLGHDDWMDGIEQYQVESR